MCTWIHESDAELICMRFFCLFVCLFCLFLFFVFFLRCFNILCYASGFYMLLFFRKMFLMRARARVCVCVVHWHCTAQLSMFNMEKRFRNKIIIIIIINLTQLAAAQVTDPKIKDLRAKLGSLKPGCLSGWRPNPV